MVSLSSLLAFRFDLYLSVRLLQVLDGTGCTPVYWPVLAFSSTPCGRRSNRSTEFRIENLSIDQDSQSIDIDRPRVQIYTIEIEIDLIIESTKSTGRSISNPEPRRTDIEIRFNNPKRVPWSE